MSSSGFSGPNQRERGLFASGADALDVALETMAGLRLDPALPVLCSRFWNPRVALRPRAGGRAVARSRSCLGRPLTRRQLVANAFEHDCSFHLVIPGRLASERKDVRRSALSVCSIRRPGLRDAGRRACPQCRVSVITMKWGRPPISVLTSGIGEPEANWGLDPITGSWHL